MNRLTLVLPLAVLLAMLAAPAAIAAPGDARLLVGTIEWPATLSTEPFAVVRGEDARPYLASLAGAQRRTLEHVAAGSRVSLLGVEGRTPYEITVVAIAPPPAAAALRAEAPAIPAPPAGPPPAQKPAPAWYYCASRQAYYPFVSTCPERWIRVPPR